MAACRAKRGRLRKGVRKGGPPPEIFKNLYCKLCSLSYSWAVFVNTISLRLYCNKTCIKWKLYNYNMFGAEHVCRIIAEWAYIWVIPTFVEPFSSPTGVHSLGDGANYSKNASDYPIGAREKRKIQIVIAARGLILRFIGSCYASCAASAYFFSSTAWKSQRQCCKCWCCRWR